MNKQDTTEYPKSLDNLSKNKIKRKKCIAKIMTYTLSNLTSQFVKNGFEWLLPVTLSQLTDPLWPDPGASIEKRIEVDIYGKTVQTTASMIFHKVIATSIAYPKLFIVSPNIRIEKAERAKTGMHIYEFSQLDFEVKDASSKDIMKLVENVLTNLVKSLHKDMKEELITLCTRDIIKIPKKPFKIYDRCDLEAKYGETWEEKISEKISDPIWIINIPREFYDFENFDTGKWDNYDLFLPNYGEALSGSKREWEYSKMLKKIERDNVNKKNYKLLLQLSKEGRIKPTSGGGIGLERVVGWISGVKHIAETQPFPRIPGMVHEL